MRKFPEKSTELWRCEKYCVLAVNPLYEWAHRVIEAVSTVCGTRLNLFRDGFVHGLFIFRIIPPDMIDVLLWNLNSQLQATHRSVRHLQMTFHTRKRVFCRENSVLLRIITTHWTIAATYSKVYQSDKVHRKVHSINPILPQLYCSGCLMTWQWVRDGQAIPGTHGVRPWFSVLLHRTWPGLLFWETQCSL